MAKIVIAELDINVDDLLKSTAELKKEIGEVKKANDLLKASGQENSTQFVENTAVIKSLTSVYNSNVKAISESGEATKQQATQTELLNIALSQEVTTISEAREQNKLLNKLRNDTNATTTEGQAQLQLLNNQINANTDFIRDNADKQLQQTMNIGNYQSALQNLSPQMNGYITQLQGMYANLLATKDGLIAQSSAMVGTTTATGGASKALNFFKIALVSTGIGAIVVALGLLITYLTTTQSGIDKVTAITRPLQAIFQSLLGLFQNVGKALFDAFSNPKKLLSDLADFVKTNLINRFKAFGVILDGIINLDFKKVVDGVAQAGTGVENMTDKVKNASKETSKFLDNAYKKGQEIDRLTKEIETSEINLNKERSKTNELIKEQEVISKNTALNTSERVKAQNEIMRLTEKQADYEKNILNLKKERLTIEQGLNDTSRKGNKEYADLEAQIIDINSSVTDKRISGIRVIATAQKEAQAKANDLRNKAIEKELSDSQRRINLFISEQGFRKKSTEEEYLFNKDIKDKELKDLKLQYDKGKISKLEYETEKNNITNNFLKANVDLLIAEGQRELDIIKANANLGIDAKLEAERNYQDIRLEQGIINEQEYQDAIAKIESDYAVLKTDKKLQDEQLERERKAIDLENKRANDQLTFEQDVEIQREQNALKLEQELLNAEKSGADKKLIEDKYANFDKQLTQSVEDFKLQSLSNTFGQVSDLFGKQSKIGKAFALYQAGIDGYQSVMKAFNSQFIPGDPSSLPRAIGAGAFAGAFAIKNIAGIAGAKFEKGGIQEVGGQRHSAGGTKFVGSDGTRFEAEKGEGIGILNRSAFSTFMDFNNRFGSGKSTGGFFQGGGIITQGVKPQTIDLNNVVDAILNIPPPQVSVSEISSVGTQYQKVIVNADL